MLSTNVHKFVYVFVYRFCLLINPSQTPINTHISRFHTCSCSNYLSTNFHFVYILFPFCLRSKRPDIRHFTRFRQIFVYIFHNLFRYLLRPFHFIKGCRKRRQNLSTTASKRALSLIYQMFWRVDKMMIFRRQKCLCIKPILLLSF